MTHSKSIVETVGLVPQSSFKDVTQRNQWITCISWHQVFLRNHHSFTGGFHVTSSPPCWTMKGGFHVTSSPPCWTIKGGFHVTSSPPCRRTKTKDLSLASFVGPPEVVHFSVVIGVSRGWLVEYKRNTFSWKRSIPLITHKMQNNDVLQ